MIAHFLKGYYNPMCSPKRKENNTYLLFTHISMITHILKGSIAQCVHQHVDVISRADCCKSFTPGYLYPLARDSTRRYHQTNINKEKQKQRTTFHAYLHDYAFCGEIPSSVPAMETEKKIPQKLCSFLAYLYYNPFCEGGYRPVCPPSC